jgi:poly(A) polymerase
LNRRQVRQANKAMENDRFHRARARIFANPAVEKIRNALSEGTSPPLYLVGGALRDAWLGLEIRDFDFVVTGEARAFASRLAGLLDARYVLLDEAWGVARLVWSPPGCQGGTTWLDFATMRGETIQEDLCQRDFTCNAMAMPLDQGSRPGASAWEDPTGGLRDVSAGIVRMVHPERLREDPLRLIRAFRLACTLGFCVEDHTLETIREEGEGILSVAAERVRDELFKILACPRSLSWMLAMDGAGLLTRILPELTRLKGLEQGDFHHLDAWHHTLEAYRTLEEGLLRGFEALTPWNREVEEWLESEKEVLPLLKLAVLFHDAGKPGTYTLGVDGKPHFYGHAALGMKIASEAMRRLRASRHDEERVRGWVRYHMGPVHMLRAVERDHLTEKAKIRFIRRLGENAPAVVLVSLADFAATKGPAAASRSEALFHRLLDSLLGLYFQRDAASVGGRQLVTGKDLIEALGISPGPTVGRLLRLLEEARVEGRIGNRAEALRLARSLLKGLPGKPL